MSSNKGANIDSQPDAEKEPVEKTTENRIFDMLERVMSIALQGFFAGSILGLVVENEPRKVTNIEQISSASPVQYEEIAVSIAKKGAHCAMSVGTFIATVETLDIIRDKKDPALHYCAGGVLSGFLAGGAVNLIEPHTVPFRFRPKVALKASVVFGLAGLGMGLALEYLERRGDSGYCPSNSSSGDGKSLDRKLYDMLFPPKEK